MTLEERVWAAVEAYTDAKIRAIRPLGGGFYGRVFLVDANESIVAKIYLFPNLARREALQLGTLAHYGKARVPKVYHVCEGALLMEYIPGENAGLVREIPAPFRARVAEEMVENLVSYHDVRHPEGFGELDAEAFEKDFRTLYYPVAAAVRDKAQILHEKGALDGTTMAAFDRALARFWDVFALPIEDARLVHGDYNTWNVLLAEDLSRVRAVIDPFGCRWSDPEFDLYQLDNANGRMYGLHELYGKRRVLSDNYPQKRAFYELFTELNHFSDANVSLEQSNIPAQARTLMARMRDAGIP